MDYRSLKFGVALMVTGLIVSGCQKSQPQKPPEPIQIPYVEPAPVVLPAPRAVPMPPERPKKARRHRKVRKQTTQSAPPAECLIGQPGYWCVLHPRHF